MVTTSDDTTVTEAETITTTTPSTTVTGLLPGTDYDVIVIAVGEEEQRSNPRDIILVTTRKCYTLRYCDVKHLVRKWKVFFPTVFCHA